MASISNQLIIQALIGASLLVGLDLSNGCSMTPTYPNNALLIFMRFNTINRGNVIIFNPPRNYYLHPNSDSNVQRMVKRIRALEVSCSIQRDSNTATLYNLVYYLLILHSQHDTVEIVDGILLVNGIPQEDHFIECRINNII